jgi:hypothetical protein
MRRYPDGTDLETVKALAVRMALEAVILHALAHGEKLDAKDDIGVIETGPGFYQFTLASGLAYDARVDLPGSLTVAHLGLPVLAFNDDSGENNAVMRTL